LTIGTWLSILGLAIGVEGSAIGSLVYVRESIATNTSDIKAVNDRVSREIAVAADTKAEILNTLQEIRDDLKELRSVLLSNRT